ncbi:DNA replication/repair protein RecF [Phreatobacter aquaticus]|uniref:DNA replication and repair protein RecF n=1 Tax=Phreatobacter aquaticus TaxID=2570229 RepID=A0A4D7QCM5_9HYPH|nr:DNA replication/repair protein RecF [Phreatobacter aquaticus]QCK85760.1 DNA replication/repair protein RecF [Phreatobacter aquaticus]
MPIQHAIDQPAPIGRQPIQGRVTRIQLSRFRSYAAGDLRPEASLVALVGPNGAGKTNVLEALSLLTPGRGLRRATLSEIASDQGDGGWALNATVEAAYGETMLGTGIEGGEEEARTRICRIDRVPVGSAAAFAEHIRVVWLTPAMDGLFLGSGGERRRFLDRLVLAVDAEHGSRVNALERSLRARNRLLEEPAPDPAWLEAVEHETAELAVAVAAARAETVRRLAGLIEATKDPASPFPWAALALDGAVENAVLERPALEVEDDYRAVLRANRNRDRAAGRTTEGPHLTDLQAVHGPSGSPAERCSTGQQKALLVGLVLAHARLVAEMAGFTPLVLLDEVAAHLDPERRAALYDALEALGAQVWMTGADPQAFDSLRTRADIFAVVPGTISRA